MQAYKCEIVDIENYKITIKSCENRSKVVKSFSRVGYNLKVWKDFISDTVKFERK